ncbi:hypothetical protein QJS10_CPB04g00764 [Acorus calamus]|uniref:Uncharacterized protein n=1 Tax=Acorus calamus TaxID=4465 RepID=A0AAV9EXT0_ACOCL|nr:hypothetical protein QJS10_CPB04g00764 [Acorus calamus]
MNTMSLIRTASPTLHLSQSRPSLSRSRNSQTISLGFGSPISPKPNTRCLVSHTRLAISRPKSMEEETPGLVDELRLPESWFNPSNALQESEWLRVTLHKWLDDEYCPEPANFDISRVAARSYYESLVGRRADLGDVLLKMAKDLESLSFKESFHGAFSSANAAIALILERMRSANWD